MKVVRNYGFLALYNGLSASLLRQVRGIDSYTLNKMNSVILYCEGNYAVLWYVYPETLL